MTVVIGIPASAEHETRSPIVGDVVKKLAGLGARVLVQRGATDAAFATPASLGDVDWVDTSAEVIAGSDVIWTIGNLSAADQAALRPGQVLMGLLTPYASVEHATALAEKGVTAFAMELLPRISRAQSMDILSSQGSASGYQCVLIAAARAPKFFPMLTYAAGTIRPSRALVIGAGVAGLQAIATAKRLGAMVQGYDVRPETREQVESLGAKFVDTGVSAAGEGGYARELTAEEIDKQRAALAKAVAEADVLITTAAVPGKKAPVIVTRAMVEAMKPGSVVVDMAAEGGGNVEGTVAGKDVLVGGARVVGPVNLPGRMPVHTSEMFSKNLLNFTTPMITDGELTIDWTDEVIAGTALTHGGRVVHAGVAKVLGLPDPTPAPAAPAASAPAPTTDSAEGKEA
ncbi:NAD(P) transhydrogenase subunit alpha [Propioniciclava sp. MC1595]|uniref:NAD(P) transhydrogenase subunit alpha n=1 Tax=unclassified Propioniciclava TaxID=2642922 RepID=UPI001600ED1F|nr:MULTISPECIES: NAD(P) transhydrogenase subunit alpha [unclassified Propioniciclava]MBB1493876.1 NAD(P) transhydrogenase subunit alpha [Propioniciclava sp. MC1595]MBB1501083.1 NAD(P) transhydrogenase subunit alpha [Propioniciclava sp. MC1683]QTE24935.1 NAD(P) transhydrogenase subunit alpha [Propioniciclava sp. MC1595]